jgi:hypothetical protein
MQHVNSEDFIVLSLLIVEKAKLVLIQCNLIYKKCNISYANGISKSSV